MKDILADVISHTHALGFLEIIKVTGTTTNTSIERVTEQRNTQTQNRKDQKI